jgi:hypothetical protein
MSSEPICCGEPMHWVIAEARSSERVAWALYRCTQCETFTRHLEHPWTTSMPSGGAFCAHMTQLKQRFDRAIRQAYAIPQHDADSTS